MKTLLKLLEVKNINKKYNKEELKEYAYNILKKNKLLKEEAAGVMFIERKDGKIILSPVVFVKEINTLFYETACGSGSVAVGIYESFKNKGSVNIDILQPSGEYINVITSSNDSKIDNARIPIDYKVNGDFFIYRVLDSYLLNKELLKEYFEKIILA